MNNWLPYRPRIAFNLGLIEQANRAAYLLDPDTGGDHTFVVDRTLTIGGTQITVPATDDVPEHVELVGGTEYVYADVPLMEGYDALLFSKDPVLWKQALNALADERDREPISLEDCEALCAGCLVGPDFDPPVPEPDPEPESPFPAA